MSRRSAPADFNRSYNCNLWAVFLSNLSIINNMKTKIIIATTKQYYMPSDSMYLPIHVGADVNKKELGYEKDNSGENISYLNPVFCELTGLYWAWKNLEADYIGLVHYRRHFYLKKKNMENVRENILSSEDIAPFLEKVKIFVPPKRKYYIETLYSHYAHTHYAEQLDEARNIISIKYPEYIPSFDKVVHHTYGHMFNMMIMQKNYLEQYCSWLFDILFELKEKMDQKEKELQEKNQKDANYYSPYQARFCGRISEIIFNVWLDYQIENGTVKSDEIKELGYLNLEGENWGKKIKMFLRAKLLHKKYESSF